MLLLFIFIITHLLNCSYPEKFTGQEINRDEILGIEIYLSSKTLYTEQDLQAEVLFLHQTGEKTFADPDKISWETDSTGIISIDISGIISGLNTGLGIIKASYMNLNAVETIEVLRKTDYTKILISEIFYDDTGSDDGKEFIEIYNGNNYQCSLSGLKIIDGAESSAPFVFPTEASIPPFSRIIIAKSREDFLLRFGLEPDFHGFSFTLNNSGETVMLLLPDDRINDLVYIEGGSTVFEADDKWNSLDYPVAPEGYSIHRTALDDTDTYMDWSTDLPSPGF